METILWIILAIAYFIYECYQYRIFWKKIKLNFRKLDRYTDDEFKGFCKKYLIDTGYFYDFLCQCCDNKKIGKKQALWMAHYMLNCQQGKLDSKMEDQIKNEWIFEEDYPERLFMKPGFGENMNAQYLPRPIFFFLNCLDYLGHYIFMAMSFEQKIFQGYKYYQYTNYSNKPTIVFIHGLGLGTFQNIKLLSKFLSDYNLFVLEIPETMIQRELENMRSLTEITDYIAQFLQQVVKKKSVLMGQSFGTGVITSLWNRQHWVRHLIGKIVMIDPISFHENSIHLFDVVNELNFKGFQDFFMKKFGIQTFGSQLMLRRFNLPQLFWHRLEASPQPPHWALIGGRDILIPGKQWVEWLKPFGFIKVHYRKNFGHAEFLAFQPREIIEDLKEFIYSDHDIQKNSLQQDIYQAKSQINLKQQ